MKNRTKIQEAEIRSYWNIRKGYRLRDAVQKQLDLEIEMLSYIRKIKDAEYKRASILEI